jgi:glycosyltransferase involved in cell wall biosynthesis
MVIDMKLPVSIILLTYNEEREIGDCVRALQSISEDIYILDSYSTDKTVEIARENKATVFQNRFTGFGDQRNWAIDNIPTQFDWQLHLDADERPTVDFIKELENVVRSDSPHAGFLIPNRLMLDDRWLKYSSGYPVYQVRLFHRKRLRFVNTGHGQMESTSGTLGYFKSPYLHYGFSKGLQYWFEKHAKYAAQEAVQSLENRQPLYRDITDLLSGPIQRRRALKRLSYRVPCRAWLRWLEILFLRRGILDGKAGVQYANMLYTYEMMTSIFVQAQRKQRNSVSSD